MAELSRITNSEAPLRDQEQALAIRRGALRLLIAKVTRPFPSVPNPRGRRRDMVREAAAGEK
jgi:hypothetical protein